MPEHHNTAPTGKPNGECGTPDSDARYKELFEHVPDGVYETALDGRILAANRALVEMLGYDSAEELMNATSRQFYVDEAERVSAIETLQRNGAVQGMELRLVRRDGRPITVIENARLVRDGEGRPLYYQGTLTDITERKAAELELRLARDQALEASRLKSQFLANMSHELRTPLNAVLGMAHLLVDSPLDRSQREYAETVMHSAHFLMEIIGQLLDFSRIEAGRLELERSVFRLREVVEDAVVMLAERAAAKGIELICSIDPVVPEVVCGDPARLRQVVTNLVGNAVKFTEEGEVVVEVSPCDGKGDRVLFEVRDSGIGIPHEARSYIFEPFRQADGSTTRNYGGTGLGLAIARQIVEKMGGQISFESQVQQGTHFWFEVPLERAPGCRAAPRMRSQILGGKRALLVEPNAVVREVMESWLSAWGVEVAGDESDCFDFAILAESGIAEDVLYLPPRCVASLKPIPPVFLLRPVGQSCSKGGATPPWLTACITKPVRELYLLETLLRELGPKREDISNSLLPLLARLQPEPREARLLIAEDNPVNQMVLCKLVEKLGYQSDVAATGVEAIEAVERQRYDLILMDCQMPRMDGFEATAAIRRMPPPRNRIPIIAVTAHAIQGDREMCLEAGMDDYLTKPIVLDELGDMIERWIDRSSPSTATGEAPYEEPYPAVE